MPAFNMRTYTQLEIAKNPERLRIAERFIATGLRSGTLRPTVDRTFDFAVIGVFEVNRATAVSGLFRR